MNQRSTSRPLPTRSRTETRNGRGTICGEATKFVEERGSAAMRRLVSALSLTLCLATIRARADVVLHEIYYNPPGSEESGEFVELHNTGAGPVDLAGWTIGDGISYTFPPASIIAPNGFLVVQATEWIGRLDNSGERIALSDTEGTLVDEVGYQDDEDWPQAADGDGASLELIRPDLDNDFPGNWAAGLPPTPGAPNRSGAARLMPLAWNVRISPETLRSTDSITVTARVFAEGPIASVLARLEIRGVRSDRAMRDDGLEGDELANDGVYTLRLAPESDRTFGKIKVLVAADGQEREFPPGADESDWYAFFVDDGNADAGGVETNAPALWLFLSPEKIRQLDDNAQVRSFGDPRFPRFDEEFDGFLVLDGRVHRKVATRHRGGFASRHAGRLKYSWRFVFPDWDRYQGRETVIVQGNMHFDDPWMRGDNGLQDKLCYLTFDRAGVPSPRTRFVRLMVNGVFFGWHVELEAIDEEFLERNGYSGRGDLYKHGRTTQAHNFPLAPGEYARAFEKKTNNHADLSSMRRFNEDLAAASGGGGVAGNVRVTGRVWPRDGERPTNATFVQAGLGEFDTRRGSVGLLAYRALADFDNIRIVGAAGEAVVEDGESIADWTPVEGSWTATDGFVRFAGPNAPVHHRIARSNALEFGEGPVTVSYDIRMRAPKTGDNWAGVALFLGAAPSHDFNGSMCAALRYLGGGSEGLHLVNAGIRWIHQTGQFDWSVGEWYRVEYTVDTTAAPVNGVEAFFSERMDLERYRRYLAGIILSTHWDSTNQNYYFYENELDEGRWVRFPWDMDITWGYSRRQRPPAQGHNLHPYDGTVFKPVPNEFGTSAVRQAFLSSAPLRESLHDELARAMATWFTETEIVPVVDRLLSLYGDEAQADVDKWNTLDTSWSWLPFSFHARYDSVYVSSRRKYLAEFLDRTPILSQPRVDPASASSFSPGAPARPVTPADDLVFTINALGTRYDGTYDLGASNLESVRLHLLAGAEESAHEMRVVDSRTGDFWRVTVPALRGVSRIYYRFEAVDDRSREGRFPDPDREGHEWLTLDLETTPPAIGDVVFNEIQYRSRHYNLEFLELANTLDRALDLGGWTVSSVRSPQTSYSLPSGTFLAANGFLVLSRDTQAVFEYHNIVEIVATDLPFSLHNASDELTLRDASGALVDRVTYFDAAPWPTAPDGGGPSAELIDVGLDRDDPASWAASARQGTPGRPNSVSAPRTPLQPGSRPAFHRGDTDQNGALELTDAIVILRHLFVGLAAPGCLESADTNNDGAIDLTDAVVVLSYLFTGGAPPAPPGAPGTPCGVDPDAAGSPGDLGCAAYRGCA